MKVRQRRRYDAWRRLLQGVSLPAAIVDLGAFDDNADKLVGQMRGSGLTLRPATKSLRVPWLLDRLRQQHPSIVVGMMTYSAHETARLAAAGFDDFLLAYPVARADEAQAVATLAAGGANIMVTVDHRDHVHLLDNAARQAGTTLRLCLDVDMSWRPLGGRIHAGVRRSPIRQPRDAVALGRVVHAASHVTLNGILAYEAQIAGLRDHNPGARHMDIVHKLIKAGSTQVVRGRRQAIAAALRQNGHTISLVNGGGTGSLAWSSQDPSLTEVTAGSGFLCSHLFDGYAGLSLTPAAFFALAIVRRSDPGFVTCAGGGYPASGAAGADRLPQVYAPTGLKPLAAEGFGEVQTPFAVGSAAPALMLGDPVICRHAKAGELAERFDDVLIVEGDTIVDRVPTYRGLFGRQD